jgi:hypothetical protein
MEFRNFFSKAIVIPSLIAVLVIGVVLWKFMGRADSSTPESDETLSSPPIEPLRDIPVKPVVPVLPVEVQLARDPDVDRSNDNDAAIEQQLDRDREEQKQTKNLKIKLEQTDLELEQEKALAEINKLKMENTGLFKEPSADGQKDLPEIKVEYIGGDSVQKEAIVSIAGLSYQVKEKSSPTDNIQVLAISDSSVTLHFSSPQELTKTIDYKPE